MMVGVPVVLAGPAAADRVYHSGHYDLAALDAAPLRNGFVENIHANGPTVYAHEQYVLNGATPNTTYQVVLMVFPGDTTCSGTPASVDSDSDDSDQRRWQRSRLPRVHPR